MIHAHSLKRVIALIITLVMITGILSMNIFAAGAEPGYGEAPGYGDTVGHWASSAIERWSGYGVLAGYAGSFKPDDPITRAEMAAVMQRVLGYTEMSENPFTDVVRGKWYYDDVIELATAGIMLGYGDGTARPETNITREEAAVLIVRAFGIPVLDADPNPFSDAGSVSEWAKGVVNALHASGYVGGKPGNIFDPLANITRAEVVTIVDNFVKGFYNKPGEYSGVINGNVIVRADEVILKDMTINGNLYVTAGVGNGKVTLDNVTVSGQIFNLGAGKIVDKDGADIPTSTPDSNTGGGSSGGGSGGSNTGDKVTVSFNTNGAQPIPPVQIARGSTLQQIPLPGKASAAFTGWYTDSRLTDAFLSESPIMNNTTLYASYADREYDAQESVPPDMCIEGLVPTDYPVTILSSTGLSSGNLSDYVYITSDMDKDIPALNVSGSGGSYTLTPIPAYKEGCRYTVTLMDEALTFNGQNPGVRTLSFKIRKDETKVVEFADGIIDVLLDDVSVVVEDEGDGGVYIIPADKYSIYMGDTVRLWDGELNQNTRYFRVMFVTKDTGSNTLTLEVAAANLADIYKNIDIFLQQQQVDMSDYIEQLDLEKLGQEVQDSEGVAQIGTMLSRAVSQSPTVVSMLAAGGAWRTPGTSSSGFQKPSMVDMKTIPGSQLLFNKFDSVEVSLKAGMTDNINFVGPNNWALWSGEDQDCWEVVEIQIKYSAKIENKVQIDAVVTVREYLSVFLDMAVDYYAKWYDPTTWNDLQFSLESWLYSQTDVAISVIAKSINKDPEFAYDIDITKEIEKLTKEKPDDADPAAMLEKVLGDKGDYIDLVSANITTIELDIIPEIPVLQAELKLDLVVRVNFAAGISTGITYMGARMIELSADLDSLDFTANSYGIAPGNGLYEIDLYAAGYLGVKVGLRGGAYVSIVGLKDLGKVGLELEFGAYADLYGFVHFNVHKYMLALTTETSLEGGLLFEFGIYLEMNLVAESKYFKAKAGLTLFEFKWPLFNIGEQYVLNKFANASGGGNYALMRSDTMPLQGAGGLFNAEFIDLKTGKKVNGNLMAPNRFSVAFSNKNFTIDSGGTIRLNRATIGDQKRAEATAFVRYCGALISFGSPTLGYITSDGFSSLYEWSELSFEEPLGMVKLIWIDPSLDISDITDLEQVFTATYIVQAADGSELWRGTREVFAGMAPGAPDVFDRSQYLWYSQYSWIDYLKTVKSLTVTGYDDFNKPITGDTTYVIKTATIQAMVSFVTNVGGDTWRRDIYAVNMYDYPTAPPNTSGKTFAWWWCRWRSNVNEYSHHAGISQCQSLPKDVLHHGYRTDTPVYTFTGTYEECVNDMGGFSCEDFYIAEYAPNYFKITLNIPDQDLFGITYSAQYKSVWFDAEEGKQITVSGNTMSFLRDMYPGCLVAGFDANGDGIADYTKDNLPIATSDMEFDVVYTFSGTTGTGYKAIFRTEYGEFRYGGVSVGRVYEIDMPGISYEFIKAAVDSFTKENRLFDFAPEPVGDGKLMVFSGWNVLYTSAREILYDAVWTQDGVYYTLTFNAGDGVLNMPADTGYWFVSNRIRSLAVVVQPTDVTPPAISGYNVEFIGWRDQNGVLYTDDIRNVIEDLYLTAEYKYTSTTPTYGVSLSESGTYTFIARTVGYTPVSARTFSVTNTGNQATGTLTAVLSGANASSFTLSTTSIGSIAVSGTGTFTVKPNDGLTAGTYTATVTVSGGNGISASFGVSFTVNPPTPLPSGVFISDGVTTEDINSVNRDDGYTPIDGYSYELEGTWVWDEDANGLGWGDWVKEAPYIPTLYIWGDGLTVSGTVDGVVTGIEDTIAIVVEDGVENITFEDLSLTAKYPTSMICLGNYSNAMTVTFKGDCSFELENGDSVFYTFVEDLLFVGADASTKLTITAGDYSAGIVYWLTGNFTIRDLDVTMIDASFENSEGTCRLRFEDANIKTNYIIGFRGYLEIAGDTHFEAEYIGWPSIHLGDYFGGNPGQLIFDEFEGEFKISLGGASVRYPAIVVFNRFKFIVGGVELDPSDYDTYYDLGGLEIMRVYDDYWYGYTDGYYWTFGDGVDPAAQVAIKKK